MHQNKHKKKDGERMRCAIRGVTSLICKKKRFDGKILGTKGRNRGVGGVRVKTLGGREKGGKEASAKG